MSKGKVNLTKRKRGRPSSAIGSLVVAFSRKKTTKKLDFDG